MALLSLYSYNKRTKYLKMKCLQIIALLSFYWTITQSQFATGGFFGPVERVPGLGSSGPNGLLPPPPPTPPPAPTLRKDLKSIYKLIDFKPLNQLVLRYLLNDAEFQAFVRIINSQQAFTLLMRFLAEPEIVQFSSWVNTQLLLSGGPIEFDDSDQPFSIINQLPYWSTTVYGWQGFIYEFQLYYPLYSIRAQINAKLLLNGIFAQFWARLQALQPIYDRFLNLPESQMFIAQFQNASIDFNFIDQTIRAHLDWTARPATGNATVSAASTPILPPLPAVASPQLRVPIW